jgi:cellulose synthase/poly-beta-1,6-N-acetylglucosamine synthase-like glycosyltransferase
MQPLNPNPDSKKSDNDPATTNTLELMIDENAPDSRALLRQKDREIFTAKAEKRFRITRTILKATIISTIGSEMGGIQFYVTFKFVIGIESLWLEVLYYILYVQGFNAIVLAVLMTTDMAKIQLEKLFGRPLRVQLTSPYCLLLLLNDIILEFAKGFIMLTLQGPLSPVDES